MKTLILSNRTIEIGIDPVTGGLLRIAHPHDPHAMNWAGAPGEMQGFMLSQAWGLGYVGLGHPQCGRTHWDRAARVTAAPHACTAVYELDGLTITAVRRLAPGGRLSERYTFTSRLHRDQSIGGDMASGIFLPWADSYPDAGTCLVRRCNTHLWCSGNGSYICGLRMGGDPPHLGLVLTEGALAGYSVTGRSRTLGSNHRGTFILHPARRLLKPGDRFSLGWTLFWHRGWEDFFEQADAMPGFLRIEASAYTVVQGRRVRVQLISRTPTRNVSVTLHDGGGHARPLPLRGKPAVATFTPDAPGELKVAVTRGEWNTTAVIQVTPPLLDLARSRCEFIARRQQVTERSSPQYGAYVIYDNEEQVRYWDHAWEDFNEGRERLGMGVLMALFLQRRRAAELRSSLERYYRFVCDKLQDKKDRVLHHVGGRSIRLYNYPWVAQLHLEMARLTGRRDCLRRFVRTLARYYAEGGDRFYAIGIPMVDGIRELERAGMTLERDDLLACFRRHADCIAATGGAYPKHEVNYEQTIVGPAAMVTLEAYLLTRDARYLENARTHLRRLEMFQGRQPDHHLYEVAIRHWDGFWFGKRKMWGDTFPHYWSAASGFVFHRYAQAVGDATYRRKAQACIGGCLSLFKPDGRASCAYLYPMSVNGEPGRFYDPYANDQDWALVFALLQDREAASS